MASPEDPFVQGPIGEKAPHSGDIETPLNEFDNTPLADAEAQYNLSGNIPNTVGELSADEIRAIQALRGEHDKKPKTSLRTRIIATLGGVGLLIGVGAGVKAATSHNDTAPVATESSTSVAVAPGIISPETTPVKQGVTTIVVAPTTTAETLPVAPVISGDMGTSVAESPTAPATPETVAPANENDPVKGGLWNKLSPEKQAAFSELAAKDWASMDSLTFINTFEKDVDLSNEYAVYLYENNIDATIKRIIAAEPRSSGYAQARDITKSSAGVYKVMHASLIEATAYDIGAKDKGAGLVLLALAADPRNEPSDVLRSEYNSADLKTPFALTHDSALGEPEIVNQGTDADPYYQETYPRVVSSKQTGDFDRKYSGQNIKNPITGKDQYEISLIFNQPQ